MLRRSVLSPSFSRPTALTALALCTLCCSSVAVRPESLPETLPTGGSPLDALSCPMQPRSQLPPWPEVDSVVDLVKRALAPCLNQCPDVERLDAMFRVNKLGKVVQFALVEPPDDCVTAEPVASCIAEVAQRVCFEPSDGQRSVLMVELTQPSAAELAQPVPVYLGHGPIMLKEPRLRLTSDIRAGDIKPPAYATLTYDVTPAGHVEHMRVAKHHFEGQPAATGEFLVKVAASAVANARFQPAEDPQGRVMWARGRSTTVHFAK